LDPSSILGASTILELRISEFEFRI
jgi:hypothetical protein